MAPENSRQRKPKENQNPVDLQCEIQAESSKSTSITSAQKNRAEKNRMKALALKKARLIANPYPTPKSKEDFLTGEKVSKVLSKYDFLKEI